MLGDLRIGQFRAEAPRMLSCGDGTLSIHDPMVNDQRDASAPPASPAAAESTAMRPLRAGVGDAVEGNTADDRVIEAVSR
jgi:hypothetical protein